ncbi:hypothetical protein [Streptomyces hundungensis]|uniref:hypothetical protein n=1 Tax=Streptomyces hundungensis TaxID=1077946 RepID=UPI001C1FD3B0|nr:hypothetical protein [Streptomyces hundungensis]
MRAVARNRTICALPVGAVSRMPATAAGRRATRSGACPWDLGCEWRIQRKGAVIPINRTRRWVVERTNSWYGRGFNFTLIGAG